MPIRLATPEDLPQILAIYAPYVTDTTHTLEYTVPSLEEFTARFQDITAQFPWLVWEEEGKILGYAYGSLPFHRAGYRWCAEASMYLHPDAHRRGIGTKLTPCWKRFCAGRVIRPCTPSSPAPTISL
jgi:phosphinothricin acetyltransferase